MGATSSRKFRRLFHQKNEEAQSQRARDLRFTLEPEQRTRRCASIGWTDDSTSQGPRGNGPRKTTIGPDLLLSRLREKRMWRREPRRDVVRPTTSGYDSVSLRGRGR